MSSRLDEVLRAGQAAGARSRGRDLWNGVAGGLTDDIPPRSPGREDPTVSPSFQRSLEVANRHDEEEAEAKRKLAIALRGKEREAWERAQREAAAREEMKVFTARIREDEHQEKRRVDAYNRGKANMWSTIFNAQMPLIEEMQKTLGHIQGTRYEDNVKLNDVIEQMVMLKSAFDLEGPDYFWRPPEAALFDHP